MDNKIFDVTRPGATPANPSSKPVIVSNQPTQTDPMMATPAPAAQNFTSTPESPGTAPASTEPIPLDAIDGSVDQEKPELPAESAVEDPPQPVAVPSASVQPLSPQTVSQEPTLSLQHQGAFFGELPKPKKWLKRVFLVIGFMLALAVAGYGVWKFVLHKPEPTPAPAKVETKPHTTQVPKANTIKAPEGYVVFKDIDLGFGFAIPNEFTTLEKAQVSDPEAKKAAYISSGQSSDDNIIGEMALESYEENTAAINIGTAAPAIQLKDGKWVVVTANPNDLHKNKVGDIYSDGSKTGITSTKINGIDVYTFTEDTEDGHTVRLVFAANNKMNVIVLPTIIGYTRETPSIANSKVKYSKMTETIQNSIQEI